MFTFNPGDKVKVNPAYPRDERYVGQYGDSTYGTIREDGRDGGYYLTWENGHRNWYPTEMLLPLDMTGEVHSITWKYKWVGRSWAEPRKSIGKTEEEAMTRMNTKLVELAMHSDRPLEETVIIDKNVVTI